MTLETTLLLISRFWSISLFHHISGIAVVPPTKFSKIACSIAAHYLKWVGHLQELRCNDTSLIPGFGQKSGSDPNCATEKWVGVKTWCLIAARLQSSLPNSTQIKLIPAARMKSSPPSSKQIQLMPAIWLQSRLPGSKLMKLSVTSSLQRNLPSFKEIKLFSQHGCKVAC